ADMVGEKYITAAQAEAAYAVKLQVSPPITKFEAPYFVDYVLKTLAKPPYNINNSDNNRKGYRVYTSLDLNLQHMAEQVVREQIAQKGNYYNFHDAALVSMNPKTGEVLAMVGGDDYTRPGGQFNLAYDVPRPPGCGRHGVTPGADLPRRTLRLEETRRLWHEPDPGCLSRAPGGHGDRRVHSRHARRPSP